MEFLNVRQRTMFTIIILIFLFSCSQDSDLLSEYVILEEAAIVESGQIKTEQTENDDKSETASDNKQPDASSSDNGDPETDNNADETENTESTDTPSDDDPDTSENSETSGLGETSDNLILIQTFDDANIGPVNLGDFYPEFATDHAFSINETIKRKGRSSGRFEIRKTDPLIWGGTRAEISQPQNMALEEGWYGFSQYFPASYTSDTTGEVIAQWHDVSDNGETNGRSPSNAIVTSNDRLKWMLRWDADRIMTSGQSDGLLYFDLGKIPKDQWIDWVVHIKYSFDNSGILEVWKDGVKVIERINKPNSYNDRSYPYLKLGIYRWEWGQPVSRVLYIDEIRVGNGNSSYNEVSTSPQ